MLSSQSQLQPQIPRTHQSGIVSIDVKEIVEAFRRNEIFLIVTFTENVVGFTITKIECKFEAIASKGPDDIWYLMVEKLNPNHDNILTILTSHPDRSDSADEGPRLLIENIYNAIATIRRKSRIIDIDSGLASKFGPR